MVRMVVPGTQGEWSAQSLLQSPETASVADVAEYYLGLEVFKDVQDVFVRFLRGAYGHHWRMR